MSDYGRVVIEAGAFQLPHEILVGALLEAVEKYRRQDKAATEGWRETGGRFLGQRGEPGAARPARRDEGSDEAGGHPKAANAG